MSPTGFDASTSMVSRLTWAFVETQNVAQKKIKLSGVYMNLLLRIKSN
jgi:hypothetical protein